MLLHHKPREGKLPWRRERLVVSNAVYGLSNTSLGTDLQGVGDLDKNGFGGAVG